MFLQAYLLPKLISRKVFSSQSLITRKSFIQIFFDSKEYPWVIGHPVILEIFSKFQVSDSSSRTL